MRAKIAFLGVLGLLAGLFFPTSGRGQGVSYTGTPIALTRGGFPAAGASVVVCLGNVTVTLTANPPCAPYASIFSDPLLTIPIAQPGFKTDGLGNYPFYVAASATYTVVIPTQGGFTGTSTVWNAPITPSGDAFFKSGRPWYDVMAFGAKNDNITDDTAAIQAAITAACATTYKGGTIYFPPGAGYKSLNTSTSPITIACDNLAFVGAGYNTQNAPTRPPSFYSCPNCTVAFFSDGGTQRFGFQVRYLGIAGNTASATSTGISLGTVGDYTVEQAFFDSFGGPCMITITGFGGSLYHNFAQNCLIQRPAATDTAAFDIGNSDVVSIGNFVTPSVPTAAGNIGTGHTYAYAIRGSNGFWGFNQGEISQHGWLVTGRYNQLIGNRAFLMQGNGFVVNGDENILTGNKVLSVSQNANGTFDGLVFTSSELIGGNIVSDNLCDDTASGNGNHIRHCVTDNNSAGVAEANANKYSSNRLGTNNATGVLYNFTGGATFAAQQPHRQSGDRGDASVTVQCGLDAETQVFLSPLTNSRTITFSATGAFPGCKFHVIRTEAATGAFNLSTVTGGSNATLGLINQYADVEFLQGVWRVTAFGSSLATTGSGSTVLSVSPALTGTPTINGVAIAGGFTAVNVTPASANTNTTSDQNLMAVTITAGALNSVSRTLLIQLAGVYSTPAASTAVITHKIKLCTVSGCGSGTVVTLATWATTALGGIQATNDPYNVVCNASTQTAGATAAFEAHGNLTIDLAALSTAAESVFADGNTTTVGTIDSTAQLFLQHTIAFSAGSASNTATDRQLISDTVD